MNRINNIVIALFLILPSISFGQDVYALQWDKPYYSAGETVSYNISVPPSFVNAQGVIQVKVFPIDRPEMAHISFLRMNENTSNSGYLDVKIDAISGQYSIMLSALDKADMKVKTIGEGSFSVINPFVDSEIVDIESISDMSGISSNVKMNFMDATSSSVQANVTDGNGKSTEGNISYFITNLDQVYGNADHNDISTFDIVSDVVISDPSSQLFYSNYSGDRANASSRVMGAYLSKSDDFIYVNAKSDEFILLVDDFSGTQDIQLIDQSINIFPVKRTANIEATTQKSIDGLVVSKYVEDYIDRRRIEQYFGSYAEMATVIELSDETKKKKSTRKASQTFNLREYENFLTLAKFFEEVSTPLILEQVDGKYTAQLANPLYRGQSRLYFKGTPLFIVDGIVTTDVDFVANLEFNSLNTVELYSSPAILRDYYSMMGKSGVVKISTSIPNFSIPSSSKGIVQLNGLQEKRTSRVNQQYLENKRYPVLGATLLSGNVPVDSKGTVSFKLPKTNERGTFLITAMFRANDGSVTIGKHTYSNN